MKCPKDKKLIYFRGQTSSRWHFLSGREVQVKRKAPNLLSPELQKEDKKIHVL